MTFPPSSCRALALAMLLAVQAQAAPPLPGSDDAVLMTPHREWIEGQRNQNGGRCCSWADGRPLDDTEIRRVGDRYEVLYARNHWPEGTGEWLSVPPHAVLQQASPLYLPIAWIGVGGHVYCLALGGAS